MWVKTLKVSFNPLTITAGIGLVAPVLSYFAIEMKLGFALPMMISTMFFLALVVVFVLMGPETKGKELTADLEVVPKAAD